MWVVVIQPGSMCPFFTLSPFKRLCHEMIYSASRVNNEMVEETRVKRLTGQGIRVSRSLLLISLLGSDDFHKVPPFIPNAFPVREVRRRV